MVWWFRDIMSLYIFQICHLQCVDSVSPCKMRWLLHLQILHHYTPLKKEEDKDKKCFPSYRSVISTERKIFPSGPQQIFIYISLVTSTVCQNSQTRQSFPPWLVAEYHIIRVPPHPPNYLKCTLVLSLWTFKFWVCFVDFQIFKLSGIYFGVWFEITFFPKDMQWYQ